MKDRKNAELDQATLRLIVATFAITYVSLVGFLPAKVRLRIGPTCRAR